TDRRATCQRRRSTRSAATRRGSGPTGWRSRRPRRWSACCGNCWPNCTRGPDMPARLLTALLLACAILGRDGSPSRPEVGRDDSPSRPGIGRDGSPSRPTPQDASRKDGSESRPYLSPADALAAFQLEPGYRIDLVAAEPLVQDPI